METFLDILTSLPLILFWSAVLSFVPTVYYLLIHNPPLLKIERMREIGIFVIGQERVVRNAGRARVRTIAVIYGLCVILFSVIYFLNAHHHLAGIRPFDILSTLSVILFGLSVITYLPIAFYLALKDPLRNREEGVCLTGIFIGYGSALLVFSVVFAYFWLKANNLLLGLGEILYSFFIVSIAAMVMAYLPICLYVFTRIANPYRPHKTHTNVIFVIYSLCFFVFATVFITNWVTDKKFGIKPIAISFSF